MHRLKGKDDGMGDLKQLEERLRRNKLLNTAGVVQRLERNLAALSLLAEWEAMLRGEQAVLMAELKATGRKA
jgi:hypothetical protein